MFQNTDYWVFCCSVIADGWMDGWTDRWTDQQKIIHRGGCHNLNKNVNEEEIIKVFNKQHNNLFEKPW